MAKAQLGTKRTCPSCGARFYDLAKSPAECPKCEHSFDPEVLLKPRRPRPEPVRVVKQAEPEEVEADEEEEEEVEVEADVVAPAEAALDTEEEDTPPETGAPARKRETPLEEDGLVVVEEEGEDDEVEIVEIEEEDGDVSGILDADLDKEEP